MKSWVSEFLTSNLQKKLWNFSSEVYSVDVLYNLSRWWESLHRKSSSFMEMLSLATFFWSLLAMRFVAKNDWRSNVVLWPCVFEWLNGYFQRCELLEAINKTPSEVFLKLSLPICTEPPKKLLSCFKGILFLRHWKKTMGISVGFRNGSQDGGPTGRLWLCSRMSSQGAVVLELDLTGPRRRVV